MLVTSLAGIVIPSKNLMCHLTIQQSHMLFKSICDVSNMFSEGFTRLTYSYRPRSKLSGYLTIMLLDIARRVHDLVKNEIIYLPIGKQFFDLDSDISSMLLKN